MSVETSRLVPAQTGCAIGTPKSAEAKPTLKCWIAVCGSLLGAFMAVLDIQITNSSLKDIQGALAATPDEGAWISTSYLVAEIIVIPLTAWLSRVFSVRRYMLINAALFLIFSVLCAFAWDLTSMILFRALQGFTGGVLIPMAFTIILTTLPPSRQPMGLAMFAVTATFAPSIGPAIGGWLTDNFGWEYIFYLNVVPGAVLIGAVWYAIAPQPLQLNLLQGGDYWGILTMAVGLGAFTVFLEEGNRKDWFGDPMIRNCAVAAAVGLTAFVVIEFTRRNPLLNLRLFARRNFGFGSLVNFILGFGFVRRSVHPPALPGANTRLQRARHWHGRGLVGLSATATDSGRTATDEKDRRPDSGGCRNGNLRFELSDELGDDQPLRL
jgi:DHA2 family multidrug resistance protein